MQGSSHSQLMEEAIRRHQAGQVDVAANIYRQVLSAQPDHVEALHLLGVVDHQQGRHAQAIERMTAALRLQPKNSAVHGNLALALRAIGKRAEAAEHLQTSLRLDPGYLVARKNLGIVLGELGRTQDAESHLRQVAAASPNDKGALSSLALNFMQQGRNADAEPLWQRVLKLQPDDASAHNNYGIALKDMGRHREGEQHLRQAVLLRPNHADFHGNLSQLLLEMGRAREAIEAARTSLRHDPNSVMSHNHLAVALKHVGQAAEAERVLRNAQRLAPQDLATLTNLGDMLTLLDRPQAAIPLLEAALQIDPKCVEALNNLAVALKDANRAAEGLPLLERAVEINPKYTPAINNLATAKISDGQVAAGTELLDQILTLNPRDIPALYTLATSTKRKLTDDEVHRTQSLLEQSEISPEYHELLHFALCTVFDKRESHTLAFDHAEAANRSKKANYRRTGQDFDRRQHLELVEANLKLFTREAFASLPTSGLQDETPIFVMGMPRSGTTLVEQILASHPQVFGAGELNDMAQIAFDLPGLLGESASFPHCIDRLTPVSGTALAAGFAEKNNTTPPVASAIPLNLGTGGQTPPRSPGDVLRDVAQKHLAHLRTLDGRATRIVDKMTINFMYVGLIALLFPKARIVHCRRDPRDSCLSCYFHNFAASGLSFTFDLEDLGFYYQQYERLMAHWHAVSPLPIFDLQYEDMVHDQEKWSRALIEFVGLPWDERCLSFHETKRQVKTASSLQVRQPIYTKSIGRWKPYEDRLQPLFQSLAGDDTSPTRERGESEPNPKRERGRMLPAAPASQSSGSQAFGSESSGAPALAHASGYMAGLADASGYLSEDFLSAVSISTFELRSPTDVAPTDVASTHVAPTKPDVETGKLLAAAIQAHQSGRIAEAQEQYRRVLKLRPNDAEALHLFGVAEHQQGRNKEALTWIERAVAIQSRDGAILSNLGLVLRALDRRDEAVNVLEQAVQFAPTYRVAHKNLGTVLKELGRTTEAEQRFRHFLTLAPRDASGWRNLGDVLISQKRHVEAESAFRQAVTLEPTAADAHNNLGVVLKELNRLDDSEACYREAIRLRPNHSDAHNNLGILQTTREQPEAALASFTEALRLKPDSADARHNLGAVLADLGRHDEAVTHIRAAIAHDNRQPEYHNSLGTSLQIMGRPIEALACYEEALRLNPQHVWAHFNRSAVWLLQGRFDEGWSEFEWRWKRPGLAARDFGRPEWDGSPLPNGTVLLFAEQGLGDTLQFIRFVRQVKQRVGRVVVECQPPLVPLLRGCPEIDVLVSKGQPLPPFDVQVSLMSLPRLFHVNASSIPAEVPYLTPDATLIDQWRERLANLKGLRVGIAWQGNPKYKRDAFRSVSLAELAPLAEVSGVTLICLQKGHGKEQLAEVNGSEQNHSLARRASVMHTTWNVVDLGDDVDEAAGAFMDTAAILKNLDLLITSDTALPHLAGALGVPTWLAIAHAPDWRWQLNGTTTPWYPNTRLFRQSAIGDWSPVFTAMLGELQTLAKPEAESSEMSVSIAPESQPNQATKTNVAANIAVPISPGELIDKITICQIKTERMTDAAKLRNVNHELSLLLASQSESVPASAELSELTTKLKAINEKLWVIEDDIRDCERHKDFGPRFIELARAVYFSNDIRATLKRHINDLLNSPLVEEKSYAKYD